MLKIRLKRIGRKGQPHYRVVVTEAHRSRNSKSVAELGFYNPRNHPAAFEIDQEEAKKWLANGAQPTETVEQFFAKLGLVKAITRGSKLPKSRRRKKGGDEPEPTPAPQPAKAEAAETAPAQEEAKAE